MIELTVPVIIALLVLALLVCVVGTALAKRP